MTSWLRSADIDNIVLPEVNRVWAPANIFFVKEKLLIEAAALKPPNSKQLISGIANARRDAR
ncbi:MAG: hypothetical protein KTR17_09325 [Cellvibrionaceae bacterium]|nr:hypothetical protein [Cellvibrionaceae bacterium]